MENCLTISSPISQSQRHTLRIQKENSHTKNKVFIHKRSLISSKNIYQKSFIKSNKFKIESDKNLTSIFRDNPSRQNEKLNQDFDEKILIYNNLREVQSKGSKSQTPSAFQRSQNKLYQNMQSKNYKNSQIMQGLEQQLILEQYK